MSIHFNHVIEAKTKQDFEEAYSEMKKKQVFLENPSLKNKISLKNANIRPTSGQSRALQEAKSSGSILDGNQLKYSKKSLMEQKKMREDLKDKQKRFDVLNKLIGSEYNFIETAP